MLELAGHPRKGLLSLRFAGRKDGDYRGETSEEHPGKNRQTYPEDKLRKETEPYIFCRQAQAVGKVRRNGVVMSSPISPKAEKRQHGHRHTRCVSVSHKRTKQRRPPGQSDKRRYDDTRRKVEKPPPKVLLKVEKRPTKLKAKTTVTPSTAYPTARPTDLGLWPRAASFSAK